MLTCIRAYVDEPEAMRTSNPWGYDWQQAAGV